MRQAKFFYRGVEDGSAAVSEGVAQGLRDAFPLPDEAHVPDRLQELVALLIERDALGQAAEPVDANPVHPTRLVVVLDDDPAMRELTVALLEDTVLDVITCDTGDQAVSLLQERGGDVAMVVTDVSLPGTMDGVDLVRAIGVLWPTIRLVVTSGQAGSRADELPGDVVYIQKPWRALDLLVQVDLAVHQSIPPVS